MPKPEPVKPIVMVKPRIRTHVPADRTIAIQLGSNQYKVVKEVYDCEPTSVVVIHENTDYGTAEYEVRLALENKSGPNRHGDSGL